MDERKEETITSTGAIKRNIDGTPYDPNHPHEWTWYWTGVDEDSEWRTPDGVLCRDAWCLAKDELTKEERKSWDDAIAHGGTIQPVKNEDHG
jgi:hypothetical protein